MVASGGMGMRNGHTREKFKKQNKGMGIPKDNYYTERPKRNDLQLFTQKKEMGVIKLQFCHSSKIYLGDMVWELANTSYVKKFITLIVWLVLLSVNNVKRF